MCQNNSPQPYQQSIIRPTEAPTQPMQDIFSFEENLPESEESEEEDVGDIVSHKYKPEGTLLTDNLYLTFRDRHGKSRKAS